MLFKMKGAARVLLPSWLLSSYHFAAAFLGALAFGFPSRRMTVVGVTGTDGKSTTTEMTVRVLEAAGYKVCSTSSVWFRIADHKERNRMKMGMPGRFFLQRFLRRAAREGCTHAVIEVSSEGVLQHRHRFIDFDAAVFTNLSREHIERHGSFENYRAAKLRFVASVRKAHVINADDEQAPHFLALCAERTIAFGIRTRSLPSGAHELLSGTDIREYAEGTRFFVDGSEVRLPMAGWFQALNALGALGAGLACGVPLETGIKGLEGMDPMPGRMERIVADPFTVLVDYAVTPRALENLYRAVRALYHPGRMICVLGSAGGGRDAWRRPVLGQIASRFCSTIILANEDPYDEDPGSILRDIRAGVDPSFPAESLHVIPDRRGAIRRALQLAAPGDAVVLSGKGSEDTIMLAKGRAIPWDERRVALEEMRARNA